MIPPVPPALDDLERLREIAELGLVNPETDPVFQQTAEEAARALGVPTALVSVVMDHAQFFAAHHGLEGWMAQARGIPVEWSFCAVAVQSREPFVVEDAAADPRTRDNPLVTRDGVRCYAGVPLLSSRGHALGTLCVLGTRARTFTPEQMGRLRELAARAVARIEERRSVAREAEPRE